MARIAVGRGVHDEDLFTLFELSPVKLGASVTVRGSAERRSCTAQELLGALVQYRWIVRGSACATGLRIDEQQRIRGQTSRGVDAAEDQQETPCWPVRRR